MMIARRVMISARAETVISPIRRRKSVNERRSSRQRREWIDTGKHKLGSSVGTGRVCWFDCRILRSRHGRCCDGT